MVQHIYHWVPMTPIQEGRMNPICSEVPLHLNSLCRNFAYIRLFPYIQIERKWPRQKKNSHVYKLYEIINGLTNTLSTPE